MKEKKCENVTPVLFPCSIIFFNTEVNNNNNNNKALIPARMKKKKKTNKKQWFDLQFTQDILNIKYSQHEDKTFSREPC